MSAAARTRALMLWCAATDKTFERVELRGAPALAGKCIHCNSAVWISAQGERLTRATIEHIVPRTHGGTDAIENLALACARCNHGKGVRLDPRRRDDPTLNAVIDTLRSRREARRREPPPWVTLPAYPKVNSTERGAEAESEQAPHEGEGEGAVQDDASDKGGRGRGRRKRTR